MMRMLGKTLRSGGKRPLQSKSILHRKSIGGSCRSLHPTPFTAFHSFQSSLSAPGAGLPVASISISRQNSDIPWAESDAISAMMAIAAAGGALLMAGSIESSLNRTTRCEQEVVDPKEEEYDDSYDNLPDDDPETTCYLCKTHRQGPCRSEWRKFEFCVKDLDGKPSTACDRYIKPFEECWMSNLSLYILIANTVNQELIADVEQDFADPKRRKSMVMPNTDWSKWMSHLQSTAEEDASNNNNSSNNGTVLATMIAECEAKTSSSSSSQPIWEYFDRLNLEPNLVMIKSQIPIRNMDGLMLRVAYAVDQDNHALGYADYYPPKEEEKDDGEDDDKEKTVTKSEQPGKQEQHLTLAICLLPGITRAVRILAVYAEEAVDEDASVSDDKPLDAFLYTTPLTLLPSESKT